MVSTQVKFDLVTYTCICSKYCAAFTWMYAINYAYIRADVILHTGIFLVT